MESLKLAAFDAEDLAVVSAHLQDAVVRVGDFVFQRERKHFALVARRFDWEGRDARRRLAKLHFERVLACRSRNIDRDHPDGALNLLAITFEPAEPPSGCLTLVFAGEASIQLDLECIEAGMRDLGPVWAARGRPAHDLRDA